MYQLTAQLLRNSRQQLERRPVWDFESGSTSASQCLGPGPTGCRHWFFFFTWAGRDQFGQASQWITTKIKLLKYWIRRANACSTDMREGATCHYWKGRTWFAVQCASGCCVLFDFLHLGFLQIHLFVGHSNRSHQLIADSITATTSQQNACILQSYCWVLYSFLSFNF